jgi:hypothetical protein
MSTAVSELDLRNLNPPPRDIASALRLQVLFNPLVLGASGFFAFAMLFATIFTPAGDPLGTWRLSQECREAPGQLLGAEKSMFSEGGDEGSEGTPIYRCDYTFTLPDGRVLQGHSFSLGVLFPQPANAPPRQGPRPVVVEYHPDHPETNRIKNTRTSPYPPVVLIVLVFPVIAALVVFAGFRMGSRRLRLLRHGELAKGVILTCQTGGEDNVAVPIAQFKMNSRSALKLAGPWLALAKGYLTVWRMMLAAIMTFGLITLGLVLVLLFFVIQPPPAELAVISLAIVGFAVVFFGFGYTFWRSSATRLPEPGRFAFKAKCTFEFRLADGSKIEATGDARLHDSPEEPAHTVLYDPDNPKRALLLDSLSPTVQISETGDWEANPGGAPGLRVLLALLLLVGPVLGAFVFARAP